MTDDVNLTIPAEHRAALASVLLKHFSKEAEAAAQDFEDEARAGPDAPFTDFVLPAAVAAAKRAPGALEAARAARVLHGLPALTDGQAAEMWERCIEAMRAEMRTAEAEAAQRRPARDVAESDDLEALHDADEDMRDTDADMGA